MNGAAAAMKKDEPNAVVMGCVYAIIGPPFYAVVMAITALTYGTVIYFLWRWFAVPALDVPPISFAQGVGIDLLVSAMTARVSHPRPKDETARQFTWAIANHLIVWPAILLATGYVVHRFFV